MSHACSSPLDSYETASTLQCETPGQPELCVIDCDGGDESGLCDSGGSTAEHRGFRFYDDAATNASIVDGFTVRNGCIWNDDPDIDKGGAILIFDSAPTIRNCILEDNRAPDGGAIALEGTEAFDPGWIPVIENCIIQNNRTVNSGGQGGAIYAHFHIDPLIRDCHITNNCTTNTPSACDCSASPLPSCVTGQGGGVYLGLGCDPQIVGTLGESASIVEDNAAGEGGGIYITDAKNVSDHLNIDAPYILRTRVGPNNRARTGPGGGIRVADDFFQNTADYPLFIKNCEIVENHADASEGGGLSLYAGGALVGQDLKVLRVTMANVLIAGNTANFGGGLDNGGVAILTASNLTFMHNRAGTGGGNSGSEINLEAVS